MQLLLGAAFRSVDIPTKAPAGTLKKGIREAKRRYKHFENNNPRSMWRGSETLTHYKSRTTQISQDSDLPDTLNRFSSRFERQHRGATAEKTQPKGGADTLSPVPPGEVCSEKDQHQQLDKTNSRVAH